MNFAREVALKCLHKIDVENGYTNLVIDEFLNHSRDKMTEKDVGLISQIVYGTVTWKLTIDEIIKKYSKIKLKKISPWILNILRMGIYQIIFLDKIPKSAAVNESVNLAKRYGHSSSKNFVNAILRKIDKKDYEQFFLISNQIERISKTTSMPQWIVEKLVKQTSIEEARKICVASNEKPVNSIRVNLLKLSLEELKEKLENKNIKIREGEIKPFLIAENLKSIKENCEFQEGFYTVQDQSAGLTSIILNPKPGEAVLDVCSAPGGKTTHLAEIMKNQGEIIAWDLHEHRISLIEENVKRLGISIIKAKPKDALVFQKDLVEKFDKILLDVPCSGTGVIKRKPDIKWKRNEEELSKINEIQANILETCAKYLKKGGEFVYSTCSILKEENQEIIENFLQKHSEFEVYYEKETLKNDKIKPYFLQNKYIFILPEEDKDGFFITKMRKKTEILQ